MFAATARLTKSLCASFAQPPKSYVVFNDVAHHGSPHLVPRFFSQFVSMVKTLERSLLLYIGKVVVPFEFGYQGNPLLRNGRKGITRNEVTISDPAPASGGGP